jgi:hypothetical protein
VFAEKRVAASYAVLFCGKPLLGDSLKLGGASRQKPAVSNVTTKNSRPGGKAIGKFSTASLKSSIFTW